MNIKNGQLKMAKSSWGTQQEVYLNPKQLSEYYIAEGKDLKNNHLCCLDSHATVIAYIHEPEETKFHCIDCTNKKYPAGCDKLETLTDEDIESFYNYLKTFDQLPMKDILCGTCSKIIKNESR